MFPDDDGEGLAEEEEEEVGEDGCWFWLVSLEEEEEVQKLR